MLVDHTIRIAQVFKIEGDLDEETRQAILTRTRGKVLKILGGIEAEIIEAIHDSGGKSAGKIRSFVQVVPYEAPIDAEVEVIPDES